MEKRTLEYTSPWCAVMAAATGRNLCASPMNADTGGQESRDYSDDDIDGGWS